jgi:hypothetical protein
MQNPTAVENSLSLLKRLCSSNAVCASELVGALGKWPERANIVVDTTVATKYNDYAMLQVANKESVLCLVEWQKQHGLHSGVPSSSVMFKKSGNTSTRVDHVTFDMYHRVAKTTETKLKAETTATAEAEATAEANATAEAEATAEANAKAEAEATAEANAKAKAEATAEANAKAKAAKAAKTEAEATAKTEAKAAKATAKTEAKAEAKATTKTEAKTEAKTKASAALASALQKYELMKKSAELETQKRDQQARERKLLADNCHIEKKNEALQRKVERIEIEARKEHKHRKTTEEICGRLNKEVVRLRRESDDNHELISKSDACPSKEKLQTPRRSLEEISLKTKGKIPSNAKKVILAVVNADTFLECITNRNTVDAARDFYTQQQQAETNHAHKKKHNRIKTKLELLSPKEMALVGVDSNSQSCEFDTDNKVWRKSQGISEALKKVISSYKYEPTSHKLARVALKSDGESIFTYNGAQVVSHFTFLLCNDNCNLVELILK